MGLEPKLQTLLMELEAGLGSALRKQDGSHWGAQKATGDSLAGKLLPLQSQKMCLEHSARK